MQLSGLGNVYTTVSPNCAANAALAMCNAVLMP